jgi:hypothetical protein
LPSHVEPFKPLQARQFEHYGKQGASECFSCCCWSLYIFLIGFYLTNPNDGDFSFFYFYLPWAILICTPLLCVCLIGLCNCLGAFPDMPEDGGIESFAPREISINVEGLDLAQVEASLREVGVTAVRVDVARTLVLVNSESEPTAQAVIQSIRVEQQAAARNEARPIDSQDAVRGAAMEKSTDPEIGDID